MRNLFTFLILMICLLVLSTEVFGSTFSISGSTLEDKEDYKFEWDFKNYAAFIFCNPKVEPPDLK